MKEKIEVLQSKLDASTCKEENYTRQINNLEKEIMEQKLKISKSQYTQEDIEKLHNLLIE